MQARRVAVWVLLLAVGGVAAWRGAELVATQARLRDAATWLERADDWQTTLFATAQALEAGDVERTSEGRFSVPWREDGAFPISVEACEAEVLRLLGTYPLDLRDHEEAQVAFRRSSALLEVAVARVTLESGVDLREAAPALHRHGADLGRLVAPVGRTLAEDADRLVADALLVAGAALLGLLVVLWLRPHVSEGSAWTSRSSS